MVFSDTTNDTGIVQRARKMARLDATQFPTANIVNSCNDRLDKIFNYGRGADRRFQLDDTNHPELPEGTDDLTINVSDYSFLVDQQGNRITNLTRIDILDSNGVYRQLKPIDQKQINMALQEFLKTASLPEYYDKIADNIIRLYPKPIASVTNGIKYYFQRSPSYFDATDTTKEPGVANDLHRGFVIQSAYDIAFTLGLQNVGILRDELAREDLVMEEYFKSRNTDEVKNITAVYRSSR